VLNATHDPALRSWLASANDPQGDFPIQNLPFGVFAPVGLTDARVGVAIGSAVLDVRAAVQRGVFAGPSWQCLCAPTLNDFMALGPAHWSQVRAQLSHALRSDSPLQSALESCLLDMNRVHLQVPARIGDYTDFYTSIHHATRVGQLLRPDNPLLPNYRWLPVAYHGRSSSIVVSGTDVRRPWGQVAPRGASQPTFAASQRLDYELELAAYVGPGNRQGEPIAIAQAQEHVFGLCLLNDWSARDIQAWEYQPLGPFLAKSFATSVSPWIVTLEALEPYRCAWTRPAQDPALLAYLDEPGLYTQGAIDIELGAWLRSPAMLARSAPPLRLSCANYRDAYWTLAQMLAHHTVGGCNLRPGDLLATGTQSGPAPEQSGSLLELTQGGKKAITLPGGEERRFLQDGDEITLTASCQRAGAARIGFGRCAGTVRAALAPASGPSGGAAQPPP
jgi:fumarylacetoacetase